MRLWPHLQQTEIGSLIIIAGFVVAIVVNAAVNLYAAILFFLNPSDFRHAAAWVIVVNFLFLIAEIAYFFGNRN